MRGRSLLPSFWGRPALTERDRDDPFLSLHREVDRIFDDFSRGFHMPGPIMGEAGIATRIDVSETENEIQVTAELPGVDGTDVTVDLTDNVLTIKGEKKSERAEKDKDYRLVERNFGAFRRDIPIPYDIDMDKVDARFAKGVLTVTMAKPAEAKAKTRKIEVKTAA